MNKISYAFIQNKCNAFLKSFYAIAILLHFPIFNSPGAKLSSKAQAPKRTPTHLRKTSTKFGDTFKVSGDAACD